MTRQGDERSVELFLDLLDRSIESGACESMPSSLMVKIETLTQGVAADLDAPIEGEVEI